MAVDEKKVIWVMKHLKVWEKSHRKKLTVDIDVWGNLFPFANPINIIHRRSDNVPVFAQFDRVNLLNEIKSHYQLHNAHIRRNNV